MKRQSIAVIGPNPIQSMEGSNPCPTLVQSKPVPTDFDLQPYSHTYSPGLLFNGLHPYLHGLPLICRPQKAKRLS